MMPRIYPRDVETRLVQMKGPPGQQFFVETTRYVVGNDGVICDYASGTPGVRAEHVGALAQAGCTRP
jgi:hypothetical protein